MSTLYVADGSVIQSGVMIKSVSGLTKAFRFLARRPGLDTNPSPIILFPVKPYLKDEMVSVIVLNAF